MDIFDSVVAMITLGLGASAFLWPEKRYFESEDNRRARLEELKAGAPETYFEERRALEAYPPKTNLSRRTIRILGGVTMLMGGFMLILSVLG